MSKIDKFVHNKEDEYKLRHLKENYGDVKKWIKFYGCMCVKCKILQKKLMSRGRSITEDKLCENCKQKMYEVFK